MEQNLKLILLIDKAKSVVGSDAELARRIGTRRSRIGDWRSGRYPCPLEYQVLMAEIAGIDPSETALDGLISRNEGTTLADRVAKALGRGHTKFVGGLPTFGRQRQDGCGCTPQNSRLAMKGVG